MLEGKLFITVSGILATLQGRPGPPAPSTQDPLHTPKFLSLSSSLPMRDEI